jgi:hypothetical protein
MNMAVGHIEDNTYPITLVNVPKGEAGKFFAKLQAAHEMRANGKKGYVSMEYDPLNPNSGRVNAEGLLTNSLINEWQIVFDRLDRELKRLGVNLDDIDRGSGITASQVLSEEESANSFVKQIMEYNASESKFAVELTMDMIRKFIKRSDKSPVQSTYKITIGNGDIRMSEVTMGMVADELRKKTYFVKVNARTGAIPSNLMKQAQATRMLQVMQPGTPGYTKAIKQFAHLNDFDFSDEDFAAPAPM